MGLNTCIFLLCGDVSQHERWYFFSENKFSSSFMAHLAPFFLHLLLLKKKIQDENFIFKEENEGKKLICKIACPGDHADIVHTYTYTIPYHI